MNWLWESDAMVAAMRARPVGNLPEGVSGISIDTRTLQEGDAYFAIRGDRVDGHDYVSAAMKAGAALAVVAEEKLVALGGLNIPLLVVRDVLKAMELLASAARARSKARIVAVTGSVGKTTTKEMLRTVLAASGAVHASVASFNNHWGVPLTLARLPLEARFGVFEIGMNHPGEIRPLTKLVRPHVAVITNVAPVHLGAFDGVDGIARAKAEIFEGVVAGGYGLINHDDKRFRLLARLAGEAGIEHLVTFGRKRGSDFRLKASGEGENGAGFSAVLRGDAVSGQFHLPGDHLLDNLMAVLGVAHLTGANVEKSVAAAATIGAVKGRGQRHGLQNGRAKFTLIDESYNANPASMRAALLTLGQARTGSRGKRIAVLGDMLELGTASVKLHRELAEPIGEAGIDRVYTIGTEIAVLGAALDRKVFGGHFKTWQAAEKPLGESLRAGDVIMLKASNGLRFGDLVEAMTRNYSVKPD
ncbi:MAG: UDP-N-acetylmuramoylalanyl-D-glutamyl-2,6-diaminopimelate--D-alanyl-D-alanine ligase [Nitratireductor sp.]|nr:UDP-N-acetylmuramoylalanyl-D-glutamyl-2,6-diaminopimelate--D-alanyl-D-alanine ligase [Nitratireductor sp.]